MLPKRGLLVCLIWIAFAGLSASAHAEPYTPAVGSSERRAVLDAVRPIAIDQLGPPVEFVVDDLWIDGANGLAILTAQRPGGVSIDLSQTPLHLRDGAPLSLIDGPLLIAYLHFRNGQWQAGEYCIGCTDSWWPGLYCPTYGPIYDTLFSRAGVCDGTTRNDPP